MTVDVRASRSAQDLGATRRFRGGLWFPVIAYAAVRLLDVAMLVLASHSQGAIHTSVPGYTVNQPMPGSPGYPGVAANWDGQWYQGIATDGYPGDLPHGPGGEVSESAWAFYPLYPLLARLVMTGTGLGFPAAAALVSLTAGLAAVTVLYALLEKRVTRFTAQATVVLLCTYVAGPVMAVAYTESVALLLVCLALLLLTQRSYLPFMAVVVLLALTRPIAMALVPVVLVHGIFRYRSRDVDPFPPAQRWLVALGAGVCVAAGALWPGLAWLVTGEPSAYLQTMKAWPAYAGVGTTIGAFPLGMWRFFGVPGLALFVLVVGVICRLVLRPASGAWGPEIRTWALSYPAYLVMATAPSVSILRYGLLAFPMMWPLPTPAALRSETPRSRIVLVATLALAGLLSQWLWIRWVFIVSSHPGTQFFP